MEPSLKLPESKVQAFPTVAMNGCPSFGKAHNYSTHNGDYLSKKVEMMAPLCWCPFKTESSCPQSMLPGRASYPSTQFSSQPSESRHHVFKDAKVTPMGNKVKELLSKHWNSWLWMLLTHTPQLSSLSCPWLRRLPSPRTCPFLGAACYILWLNDMKA